MRRGRGRGTFLFSAAKIEVVLSEATERSATHAERRLESELKVSSRRFVVIRADIEGLHCWPNAPEAHRYLSLQHRHLFIVTSEVEVSHNNREIEINEASRWLLETLKSGAVTRGRSWGMYDFGSWSCEDIAEFVGMLILHRYASSVEVKVTVLEDGILGGGGIFRRG